MTPFTNTDKLEMLGLLTGAFLILVALGTLLEPPWTTTESMGPAMVQTLGVFLSIGVALLLIEMTSRGGLRGFLPGSGSDE